MRNAARLKMGYYPLPETEGTNFAPYYLSLARLR